MGFIETTSSVFAYDRAPWDLNAKKEWTHMALFRENKLCHVAMYVEVKECDVALEDIHQK